MKIFRYTLLVVGILILASCDKFLDVEPQTSVSDDNTITNGASAETALRGMYRSLAGNSYYGTTFPAIGYLSGDNIEWTGSRANEGHFVTHTVKSDNAFIESLWRAVYSTINRANHVISKVQPLPLEPTFTEAKKNQVLGEAYFVRALSYFDLNRTFGGVPIYLEPTLSTETNRGKKRATVEEVYAQVLSDLTKAEALLPSTTNRVRATKKTASALLARYYLYQKNWAQAEAYADKLIPDASYSLIKPYNSFFANNATNTQESIFELAYSSTNTNGHRGNWQPPQSGGTRQWAPNAAFVALINNLEIGGNRRSLAASTTDGRWYGTMYYRSPAIDPAYVIRIAEMRLIRAEARAQRDNLEGAKADLNAVRNRAELVNTTANTKADILLAIENERRLEFAFEADRWFDLVRTDRAAAIFKLPNTERYLMPIPLSEILNDPALEQNKGY